MTAECETCGKVYGTSQAAANACCQDKPRPWDKDDWG